MGSFFKWFSLIAIMLFSFYYTEKIALLVQKENPLRIKIEEIKSSYEVESVNAIIEDKYIIPGLNGEQVNVDKSFINMKSFGDFNKYYLIYDKVKPSVSLTNNLDKIIKKGNSKKKEVSIIIENISEHKSYFINNNIKINLLVDNSNVINNSFFEQINVDNDNFTKVNDYLDRNNMNKKICILNNKNYEICKENKYYIVDVSLRLNNSNIIEIKNSLENGSIIYIDKDTNLDYIKLLLKYISNQGLSVALLSNLISENH